MRHAVQSCVLILFCFGVLTSVAQQTPNGPPAPNPQPATPVAAPTATTTITTTTVTTTTPPTTPPTTPTGGDVASKPGSPGGTPASQAQVDALQKQVSTIQGDLSKQDSEFALTLGIGSLVLNSDVTDYSNTANVLQANSLGRATPQYLAGVSMRTAVPNFGQLGAKGDCAVPTVPIKAPPDTSTVPPDTSKASNKNGKPPKDNSKPSPYASGLSCGVWRRRPWEGFVSIKFAPGSSQTINGYVLGGSYAIGHYLDVLIGFALTPVNEPSPGFRVVAAQYVTQQQQLGLDLNFNSAAMLQNQRNAFDGFPITSSAGKLIYTGNALEIHYRGGAVFGVSIPFTFSSVFSPKTQQPSTGTP